jgi:hypothetical protein
MILRHESPVCEGPVFARGHAQQGQLFESAKKWVFGHNAMGIRDTIRVNFKLVPVIPKWHAPSHGFFRTVQSPCYDIIVGPERYPQYRLHYK